MQVSMIPNGNAVNIYCSQNDTELRKWSFALFSNDVLIEPFGDAFLVCENGTEIPLTVGEDELICDCTAELSSSSGTFKCKIKIEDGDKVVYSSMIKLHCEVKP